MAVNTAQIGHQCTASAPPMAAGKFRLLTLDQLDGRTAAAKRARELIEAIEADLGGGDRLSEGSRQLIQRAAVLGTFIESCEAQWLRGEEVALADYLAAINAQRRVLATVGFERRARDVTPTLAEYLANEKAARSYGEPNDAPKPLFPSNEDERTGGLPNSSANHASEAAPVQHDIEADQ